MKNLLLISFLFIISSSMFAQNDANGFYNDIEDPNTGTAVGIFTESKANFSFAAGYYSKAMANGSFALGKYVQSIGENAWVIGSGIGRGFGLLTNRYPNSLMIGFGTTSVPSIFVEPFNGLSGGFVGIHTERPSSELDVEGTITTSGLKLRYAAGSVPLGWVLTAAETDGTVKWAAPAGGTGADPYIHPSYTSRNINTNGATVIDMITSDNIGSITSITTRTLTLANLGYSGAYNANYYVPNGHITSSGSSTVLTNAALLYLQDQLDFGDGGGSGTIGGLWKESANKTDIYYSPGKVGIGIVSPEEALHVAGIIKTEGGLLMDRVDNNNNIVFGRDNNSTFSISRKPIIGPNINILNISTDNYVGIGTNSPSERLHIGGNDANIKLDGYIRGGGVNGALRIESNLAGYTEIGVMNSSASHFITDRNMFLFNQKLKLKEALIFDSSSDASIEFGSYSIAKTLRIVSLLNGVDKSVVRGMVINPMGRVGIGTDTPTSELATRQRKKQADYK